MKWEILDWTNKFLLLKIPTERRYCERLAGISNRDPAHSWADIKYTINNVNKTNLNV